MFFRDPMGDCVFKLGQDKRIYFMSFYPAPRGGLSKRLHPTSEPDDVTDSSHVLLDLNSFLGVHVSIKNVRCLFLWENYSGIALLFYFGCPQQLRCVLLLCLTVACGGTFLLEQPRSSIMGEYFRMQWFTSMLPVPRLNK